MPGDNDKRRKRADARRGMLEEAEKFKDDDVHVGNIVRVSVWEQFARAIRELRDRIIKFLDLLENDVSLLKSRFGVPLSVGFDCRRQFVQSLLYPLLLIWLPITVVMAIRGDVKSQFETRLYVSCCCCLWQRSPPPTVTDCPQRHHRPIVEAVAPRRLRCGAVLHRHGAQCSVGALQARCSHAWGCCWLSHFTAACRPEFSSRLLSGTGIRPFPAQVQLPAAPKSICAMGLNLQCIMRLIRMDLFKLEDDQTKAKFSVVLFEFGCCELFNVSD